MERQSRTRRILSNYFVIKPIGFVIFLMFGILAFLIIGSNVKIPVYTTVQTTVEKEDNFVKFKWEEHELMTGDPIYIYCSRDDYLEKIVEYRMEDGYLKANISSNFSDMEKINIDIKTDEVTLLEHIFMNGGNIQ